MSLARFGLGHSWRCYDCHNHGCGWAVLCKSINQQPNNNKQTKQQATQPTSTTKQPNNPTNATKQATVEQPSNQQTSNKQTGRPASKQTNNSGFTLCCCVPKTLSMYALPTMDSDLCAVCRTKTEPDRGSYIVYHPPKEAPFSDSTYN